MSKFGEVGHRLYTGDISYDFIARRRRWYALSGVVLLISVVSLLVRGLSLSIEFTGGSQFTLPANGHDVSYVTPVLDEHGIGGDKSRTQSARQVNGSTLIRVTTEELNPSERSAVQRDLAQRLGDDVNDVKVESIGSSWGQDITKKALEGLVLFLIAVVIYLSLRYEPKMAAAAIIALLHDLVITAGIYSLVGFEVSPSTVIALLTILGYSLYDTVVVFDKVRENTQGLGQHSRHTFSQATNLAVNQTLVRSINTSVIALLPVAGLLFIGAGLLGAGTLKDLSLALFIGLAAGAYSSIFIASPLLCDMKEREPAMRQLAKRVANREAAEAREGRTARGQVESAPAATGASVGAVGDGAGAGTAADDLAADQAAAAGARARARDDDAAGDDAEPAGVSGGATMRNPRAAQPRRRPGGRPAPKRRR